MSVIRFDTLETVIKKLFDAIAGDVSSSFLPLPPLFSLGRGKEGVRGIVVEQSSSFVFFFFVAYHLVFLFSSHFFLYL